MAVPEGIITTSDILVPEATEAALDAAIVEADAEEATEEYVLEEVETDAEV